MKKEIRIYNGEKTVSSINDAEKTGELHVKKWNLENSLTPYAKVNSEWTEDLNAKWDIIKLLEKDMGRTLWHNLQQGVIDILSGVIKIKAKIKKWDLIKLNSFAQHRKQ